jgi:hypothetical protein
LKRIDTRLGPGRGQVINTDAISNKPCTTGFVKFILIKKQPGAGATDAGQQKYSSGFEEEASPI